VKELDTLTVTKVSQGTLPKWWRDAAGLKNGGVVEVRPVKDEFHPPDAAGQAQGWHVRQNDSGCDAKMSASVFRAPAP